jgi:hypothetical protein
MPDCSPICFIILTRWFDGAAAISRILPSQSAASTRAAIDVTDIAFSYVISAAIAASFF